MKLTQFCVCYFEDKQTVMIKDVSWEKTVILSHLFTQSDNTILGAADDFLTISCSIADNQLLNCRRSAVELLTIGCWIADDQLLNCWRSAIEFLTISCWFADDQLVNCWRSAGELLLISCWIADDQLLICCWSGKDQLTISWLARHPWPCRRRQRFGSAAKRRGAPFP